VAWSKPDWPKDIVGSYVVEVESIEPNPFHSPPLLIGTEKLRIGGANYGVNRQEYPICCGLLMFTSWYGQGRVPNDTVPIIKHWIKSIVGKTFNWAYTRPALTAVPNYGQGGSSIYNIVMDTGETIARFKNAIHPGSIIHLVLFRPDKLGVSTYDFEAPALNRS
jgi:hypothetical protein